MRARTFARQRSFSTFPVTGPPAAVRGTLASHALTRTVLAQVDQVKARKGRNPIEQDGAGKVGRLRRIEGSPQRSQTGPRVPRGPGCSRARDGIAHPPASCLSRRPPRAFPRDAAWRTPPAAPALLVGGEGRGIAALRRRCRWGWRGRLRLRRVAVGVMIVIVIRLRRGDRDRNPPSAGRS